MRTQLTQTQREALPHLQPQTLRLIEKSDRVAQSSSLEKACAFAAVAAAGRGERSETGPAAAGLVPFKTTRQCGFISEISFSKSIVAERRINRLKRSVWASGHLHGLAENGFRPSKCWFVTLTYAQANAWAPTHLSEAIRGYRSWCKSSGVPCRYTWVAEIQPGRLERTGDAVVHYHLLAWLPIGVSMPHWDKTTRKYGGTREAFWIHGMTNTEKSFSGVGYLMKYLSKLGELTIFPKGLRLYGIGGLTGEGRAVRRWYNLPEWVKLSGGVGDVIKAGNAFVHRQTGEVIPPAYSVKKTPWGLVLTQIRDLPQKFFDGAFSTFPRVQGVA